MKNSLQTVLIRCLISISLVVISSSGLAQEPLRIAFIDPLSGSFASIGNNGLKQLQFAADYFYNSKGGILDGRRIEIVPLDNKQSPTETQLQFRRAVGEGIQIIFQGNSSAVANTLNSAIIRHNRRNPGQEVLQINYSAVDPVLTEENCSFWHFRFDAHVIMKLEVLTDYIAMNNDIKSVYIIGQDYSFGQAVSDNAIAMLKAKRPDIDIVGNEFHPIGQVKDFTPYVTKIVASGADAVITGNFGADMVSLARSIIDSGLKIPIYTFYAAYDGITATLGEDAKRSDRLADFMVHTRRDLAKRCQPVGLRKLFAQSPGPLGDYRFFSQLPPPADQQQCHCQCGNQAKQQDGSEPTGRDGGCHARPWVDDQVQIPADRRDALLRFDQRHLHHATGLCGRLEP